ncbi:PREDICTED: uncharacterized protein LOC104716459 [Camelina sativa]|uniref:Uncharacterized protein LOC104716459 n=1 Tax=Camelina sativa TaxID=90675 RepID=A0ABM1QRH4_CAMSA|nr:PREDICTED: uncharacterized protein LOC104716459 [Camelina sativa]
MTQTSLEDQVDSEHKNGSDMKPELRCLLHVLDHTFLLPLPATQLLSLSSMVHVGHGGYTRSQVKSPDVCSVGWWTRGRRLQSQTQRPRCMLAMEDTQGAK